jgi:CelD/BcsL family acetyltransferase involved in cellulose biosynthesis
MSAVVRKRSALNVRRLRLTDPGVGAAWRRLQRAGGVDSPFLAWEWVSAFADVPEAAPGTGILAADDGHQILGLLPVQPLDEPGRLRTWGLAPRWLGADHLDVVAEPRLRPEVARALAGHLASWPAWEILDLDGLDPSGSLAAQAHRTLHPPRFLPMRRAGTPAPYVALRGPDAGLHSNAMKEAARKARGAERSGGGLSVARRPDQVAELLAELIELHNRRMGDRSAVFATAPRRRFHLLAARRMAEAGMARIYRLAADGVTAALQYDLVLGDRIFFYQSGIAPGAGRSPGLTVLGRAIRAAADEGFAEFDLLRGDEPYKRRFATGTRSDVRLIALRLAPRAALHGGAWIGGRALRHLSRHLSLRLSRRLGAAMPGGGRP